MDILYLTCSIPSVAILLVDIYMLLPVATCGAMGDIMAPILDLSVGHHPYGIKSMVPNMSTIWTSLDLVSSLWVL